MSEPRREDGKRTVEHYLLLGLSFAALAGVAVLGLWMNPDPRGFGTHEQLGLAPCRSMEWLGFPCPGCGVTTSVSLFWHGELWASFVNQPFGCLFAGVLPLLALGAIVAHFRGRDLYLRLLAARLGRFFIALGSLMLAAWIYKILQH
jgi:hypothetical protein